MRNYQSNASRLTPPDRAPVNRANTAVLSAVAPHANTTRLTYTCPTDKKAKCAALNLTALRQTAAAPVGEVKVTANVTTAAAATARMITINMIDNTIGVRYFAQQTIPFALVAAELCYLQTADASTNGTYAYDMSYFFLEYDA